MDKIQLEKVEFDPGKSFKLFSPRLRNTFLWHYHPEIELVYVEAGSGIRHVGSHISTYTKNDLVLIGGNLPHLNFDYRQRSEYEQIVIQLKTDFMGNAIGITREFAAINTLLKNAVFGIAFYGDTKVLVAEKLRKLQKLNMLDQLLELMSILQLLAVSREVQILNSDLKSTAFLLNDKIRMGAIYKYIDANFNLKPDVNEVARSLHLTTPAFCRYFKKQTNITFTEFVNQYRIERARNLLMQNRSVSESCYAVGFENLSYFNKLFKQITGENPSVFKKTWLLTV